MEEEKAEELISASFLSLLEVVTGAIVVKEHDDISLGGLEVQLATRQMLDCEGNYPRLLTASLVY